MAEPNSAKGKPPGQKGDPRRRELPRWKKILLTSFAFLLLVGLALRVYGYFKDDGGKGSVMTDQRNLTRPDDAGGAGFVETGRAPGSDDAEVRETGSGAESWSPVLMKGSMSFLVGFSVGYALRTFFKISAVVLGLVCLAIFGLSYAGLLQVDWATIQAHFDQLAGRIQEQASGFKEFISGSLPSAGLGTAGLVTGFKR
jgi:uncharacterized membrane protein (Fun14 family)